jgi:hypothetical protein
MESEQFDRIVKGLGQPASRRTAGKAVAMGAIGLALTRLTTSGAEARTCRANGQPCRRNRQCCSRECHHDICEPDNERD